MELHLLLLDDGLDLPVLGADDLQQILSESLRPRNLLFIRATDLTASVLDERQTKLGHERDMNVHRFVSFSPRLLVHETGTDTLDLYPRLCLLLNIFHKNALFPCQHRTICTEGLVITDGPTTLALTLKFRIDSRPTGSFSSGHLRCKEDEGFFTKGQECCHVPSLSADLSYPPRGTLDPCLSDL